MARDQRRALFERTLGLVRPAVVPDFTPPPCPLAEGLWVLRRTIRLRGGIDIPTHTSVVRLRSGDLLVHSPFKLDPVMQRDLATLGAVAHLVAPNSFHYLFLAEHQRAFPDAAIYLAPGLRERRPAVPKGTTLGERPPPAWEGELDQAVLGPTRGVAEVAFCHRASATLILTDLAFNIATAATRLERSYWRLNRVWQRFGPTLLVRRIFLRDVVLVRAFVARVLAWEFDRIVVSHGEVVERDGRAVFSAAFARYR